jgi:hypothetical protein
MRISGSKLRNDFPEAFQQEKNFVGRGIVPRRVGQTVLRPVDSNTQQRADLSACSHSCCACRQALEALNLEHRPC